MATVSDVIAALEVLAPTRFAFPFDKVGLQVGDPGAPVTRGVVSLDRSLAAVEESIAQGAQILVSHHPLIFEPVGTVTTQDHVGQTILKLAENRIAFAAAHTNWDSAIGGINDALAAKLGLADVTSFGPAALVQMLKLVVFAPPEAAEAIIDAAAKAGAGVIGNYSRCSFSSEGTGSFLGNEFANPSVGKAGQVKRVPEVRIEMILRASLRPAVETAVREAHPYEEAAYDFYSMPDNPEQPCGRIGRLATPVSLAEWVEQVDGRLQTRSWAWGDPQRMISTVALVGGAADGEWETAQRLGADVYITGEVRQHVALEASETGIAIVAAGHYATEHPGCEVLAIRLRELVPSVEWSCFAPPPGQAGRPVL